MVFGAVKALPIALILALVLALPAHAQGPRRPHAVPVKVAPVQEQPVVEEVSFIATVEPSVTATVGAEVEGRVVTVPMHDGEYVREGKSVLIRIDAGPREIQLREARAAVDKARQELEKLRRGSREEEIEQRAAEVAEQKALMDRADQDYRRAQRLHADEMISTAELQGAESLYLAAKQKHQRTDAAFRMTRTGPRPEEIGQAEAELAQARARADRIADEIRRTTVLAPISGFVLKKAVNVGAWLRLGDRIAEVISLDPVTITGAVGEREIERVRVGSRAAVTADALPDRRFSGNVTAVVPGADTTSRTFPVKVRVQNRDGLLKSGMFARVSVQTGAGRTGLFLPKDAVVRRGGQEFIFLVNGDAARQVKVKSGTQVGGLIEVSGDGLTAGLKAVTLGNEFLQPGMKVVLSP